MPSSRPWIIATTVLGFLLLFLVLFLVSPTFSRNMVTIANTLRIPTGGNAVIERGGHSLVPFPYPPVGLTVLTSSECTDRICQIDDLLRGIRLNITPALRVNVYDIGEERGKALAEQWKVTHIPVFAFDATVVRTETYPLLEENFSEQDGLFFLRIPSAVPVADLSGPARVAVSADDDAMLGNADAPVTIIEFSDFQCPACRFHFTQTMNALKATYVETGKVRFVYRDFPLDNIHPDARKAAEAAECAAEQGKFWEMHDMIFTEQQKQGDGTVAIPVAGLQSYAATLGLNTQSFNTCLDTGAMTEEVQKDYDDGVAAGVNSTPTFFVNGEKISGAVPLTTFAAAIERALSAQE